VAQTDSLRGMEKGSYKPTRRGGPRNSLGLARAAVAEHPADPWGQTLDQQPKESTLMVMDPLPWCQWTGGGWGGWWWWWWGWGGGPGGASCTAYTQRVRH